MKKQMIKVASATAFAVLIFLAALSLTPTGATAHTAKKDGSSTYYCMAHAIPAVTTDTCYSNVGDLRQAEYNKGVIVVGKFFDNANYGGSEYDFWASNDCSSQNHFVDNLARLSTPNGGTWNNRFSSGIVTCNTALIWGGVNQSGASSGGFYQQYPDFHKMDPDMDDLTTSLEFTDSS